MLYVWLAITVVAIIVEVTTTEMLSIWFAGGSLLAMLATALKAPLIVQICVFVVVSLILLVAFRKMVLKKLSKGETNLNADSAVGKEFELLTPIQFNSPGSIKVNDVVWNVVLENQSKTIPEKTIVKVVGLKGNKYIVEEVK
jgi:membrane protein implicated in regulation of membrane protease activity